MKKKNLKIAKLAKGLLTVTLIATIFSAKDVFAETSGTSAKTYADALPETVVRNYTFRFTTGLNVDDKTKANNVIDYNSKDFVYQLYCSDRKNGEVGTEDVLTKGTKMDYGIAYILKNAGTTTPIITGVTGTEATDVNHMANLMITQLAIWGYQGTASYADTTNAQLSYTLDNVTSYEMVYNQQPLTAQYLWNGYVNGLITKAKATVDPANTTMSATMNGKWTDDGKNKKSGLITVNISNGEAKYSNYAISLVNAPTTTKVYTEAGQQVSDLNNIPAGTKIYLVVPKDSISEGKTFTLNANATITYDAAYQYVDKVTNTQPSVLVGPETKQLATALTIVPDTASSISNSIYFIGFIILLSGAGIIYANVKPRTQENN